jgi:tRNA modification GTPase
MDTIAAISSVPAPSARIIVRLSGSHSHVIASEIANLKSFAPASAQRVILCFSNLNFPAWIYAFHSPHSYTGEDSIEFHIPGSPVLAKMLLDELYHRGARAAEPGEFTARAFFNGKIGLTEAEGVAATISAGNEAELSAARQLLAGELAKRLAPITDSMAQTLALIEVGIDFTEEDVTFLAAEEISQRVADADSALAELLDQSARFEQLTHEPRIVCAGRPNAGKSSLINALTNQTRAIVSDVAGTTRDVLTAALDLPRGRVVLADVAGIELHASPFSGGPQGRVVDGDDASTRPFGLPVTNAMNLIDRSMQQHTKTAIESADHVVLVRDCTDERPTLELARHAELVVLTKMDLRSKEAPDELRGVRGVETVLVSSKTGDGMDKLRDALDALAFGTWRTGATLALNRRHIAAIHQAREALSRASLRVTDNAPELVAMDLRDVLDSLGSIVGQITRDDVLGRIFSAFCIGK